MKKMTWFIQNEITEDYLMLNDDMKGSKVITFKDEEEAQFFVSLHKDFFAEHPSFRIDRGLLYGPQIRYSAELERMLQEV